MVLKAILGLTLVLSNVLHAGGIREVYVNAKKMQTIYLKMGQSTVLRFREKPEKVVVGNSNYYNVEFINSDITLQPQEAVPTNLFVYGEYHTFGFNLKVNHGSRFDDLVEVRWESPRIKKVARKKRALKKLPKMKTKKIAKMLELSGKLKFFIKEIKQNYFFKSFDS